MGLAITEEHRELESVAADFLKSSKAREAARALLEAETESLPPFWEQLVELGWLGLHLPEAHGGSGYGLSELAIVTEQLGRSIAPGPFTPTVAASAVISMTGDHDQSASLLPALASGQTTGAVGLGGALTLTSGQVSGDAGVVLGSAQADHHVLAVGQDMVVIDATADGVHLETPENVDLTRRSSRVRLEGVDVDEDRILRHARGMAVAVTRLLFAAEAAGALQQCVEMATAYAKEREQFGRPIGMFQAVKHHCADMLVIAETAVAAVWDAARAAEASAEEFELAGAVAAALAIAPLIHVAQLNTQVHGGIGFTWEHDAHLLLRRGIAVTSIIDTGASAATDVTSLRGRGVERAPGLDLPASAQQIREEVRAFAEEVVTLDEKQQRRRLIDTGYVMPHWPRPWGRAADAVEQLVIDEEFARAGVRRPQYGITGWVILTLIQHGTQDQIDRWVRPALEGEVIWCQLFSEPAAGSDAAGVTTRAVRVDGGWVLNGQKVWTSGAHQSRYGLATVRTDPEAPKHRGITTVVIDMEADGVEVRPLRDVTGNAPFNEVFLTDVFIPDEDVVGAPNDGWTVARATLGNERVSIGGGAGGGMVDVDLPALLQAHGEQLPGGAHRVGEYLAEDHALKLLNLRRAARAVVGAEAGPEGNVTKLVLAEHGHERAAILGWLHGQATAFAEGDGAMASMMLLYTRGMSIAGGTSEITRNQIAERILGLPRDPLLK